MINGYWIILDEMNLAPSDALELLNRLLDDNREIYIPEIDQKFVAHPKFRIFATQNPVLGYSGRNKLSKAFLDRFISLEFTEIPHEELVQILFHRFHIPEGIGRLMIDSMKELQVNIF